MPPKILTAYQGAAIGQDITAGERIE